MSQRYTVLSARLAGHDQGDVITASQLDGTNVEALVAGGHLEPVKPAAKKAAAKKKGEG